MNKHLTGIIAICFLFPVSAFAIPPFDDGGGCQSVQYKWAHVPTIQVDATPNANNKSYTLKIPQLNYTIENGGNYDLNVVNLQIDLAQNGDKIDYKIYGGHTNNEDAHSAWSGVSIISFYPKELGSTKAINFKVEFNGRSGNGHSAPSQPITGSISGELSKIKNFTISAGEPHDTVALDDDSLRTCHAVNALQGHGWTCDGSGCHGPGTAGGGGTVWTF